MKWHWKTLAFLFGLFPAMTLAQVTGSGTSGTVPVFTGSSPSSTVGNSPITVSGSYVGIGTTSPNGGLDVNPPLGANSWIYLRGNLNGTADPSASVSTGIIYGWNPSGGQGESQLLYGTGAGYQPRFDFGRWNGSVKTIDMSLNNGNVGIGTITPSATLDVNGSFAFRSGGITFPDFSYQSTAYPGTATGLSPSVVSSSLTSLGTVTAGVWNATPLTAPYLPADIDYTDQSQVITGQKSFTSNVGLGTSTPAGILTVASPAQDGAGTPTQGLLFVDTVFGTTNPWSHAAIYTVGSPGYNGNLVFATDGDSQGNINPTERMRILYNGNVGIGTATPGATLEVNGNIKMTANPSNPTSITFADSTVQTTAWNGILPGGDYAESVDVLGARENYEPGDLIVIDSTAPGKFQKSDSSYSRLVAGVFSTKPGLVGRRATADRPDKKDEVPMAMMGIVPTKVCAENGAIAPGDLLVSSSTPGYAMKGTDRDRLTGAILGKALAPLASGSGVIEVLISLQ